MMGAGSQDVPADWARVPDEVFVTARTVTLEALGATDIPRRRDVASVSERIGEYYDPETNYAGATFLDVEPHDPNVFTVSDLYAVTLLSVDVDALSTRRFIEFGSHRKTLTERLSAIPPDANLLEADSDMLSAMADLHQAVRSALAPRGKEATSRKWVTAAKLCTRKRPDLFPVRDSVVCQLLGIQGYGNYEVDYQVFRHLIQDDGIRELLTQTVALTAQENPRARLDASLLRVLDVALWTYALWRILDDEPPDTHESPGPGSP